MKNILKIGAICMLLVVSFSSCTQEDSVVSDSKLDLSDVNIKLANRYEFPPTSLKVKSTIAQINKEILNFKEEDATDEIITGFTLSLTSEKLILNIDDISVKSNLSKSIPVSAGVCPSGMVKVKKCYSQSCAQGVIVALGGLMENGDSFSVHRQFSGVTICASVRLANEYKKRHFE
jgi:hypothetical protein